jgi:predicted nuclease of predicted toxin-antitoxin system
MRFLIDECLSPTLTTVAHEAGFAAAHVLHRGWGGLSDVQLRTHVLREELVIVTNNGQDFRSLLGEVELHPGLIVLTANVRRESQCDLFALALHAATRFPSLVNRVLEVDGDGTIRDYELPVL